MTRSLLALLLCTLCACASVPQVDIIAAPAPQARALALVSASTDIPMLPPTAVPDITKDDTTTPLFRRLTAAPTNPKVVKVEFYRGDLSLIGSSTTPPYALPVQIIAAGPRTLYAIGKDAAGVGVEFLVSTFTVTVAAQPPPPPPPPPPVGTVLARYQFTAPGWATFGLALPKGAAPEGVQVRNLVTQLDVKNRWPGGSLKFGIVTVKVVTPGAYDIVAAPLSGGQFTAAVSWPAVEASFVTGGQTYVATLPALDSSNHWLAGPLARESRVVVSPKAGAVAHQLLQVVFDVRSYADGAQRVDVTVQNVKDVTAGAVVTYDLTVTVNTAVAYRKPGVSHQYMTRGRKLFAVGLTEAAVVPDFEPAHLAGALPRLLPTVVDPRPVATGPAFDLLGFGEMPAVMASEGGRGTIGPLTWIDAQFIAHKRPEQREYMLRQADLSGSWSGHITEADGTTLVSLDAYPTYWLDGRAGTRTVPVDGATGPNATRTAHNGGLQPGGNDTGWQPIDEAHMPSLTYVPYLVTGDRYYLDQMKFYANFAVLAHGGRGAKGVLYDSQIRGWAWGLRAIEQAGAYLPDLDPMQSYFRTKAQANITALDTMAIQASGGPFGWFLVQNSDDPHIANQKNLVMSPWMNGYVDWVIDYGVGLGYTTTGAAQQRITTDQIRLMTSEALGFPRMGSSIGWPHVGIVGTGYHATMAQIWTATKRWHPELEGQPWNGYYGVEARLVLQIAKRQGVPRAQELLDYLMAQPGMPGDVEWRSGFAVLP